jgi:hypothetical protein
MEFSFEPRDDSPWGSRQPKFERIVTDGPDRYFLVGQLATGEPVSVLAAATFEPPPWHNGD